jgi:two-component system, sensor histidine kinase and response regulator
MPNAEKPFVLLVDDNEATCTLIAAVLQPEFAVDVASDGAEAIDKLRTGRYAAILLDLRMPQQDGFAVLDFVKEHAPEQLRSVLVVTATLRPAEIARAKAYDICGIVAKPFDVDALLESVKQCVSRDGDIGPFSNVIASGSTVIMLLADLLRQRLM